MQIKLQVCCLAAVLYLNVQERLQVGPKRGPLQQGPIQGNLLLFNLSELETRVSATKSVVGI